MMWRDLSNIDAQARPTEIRPAIGCRGSRSLRDRCDGPTGRSPCGQLSILETAAELRRATLSGGIDSGPEQLANAAGAPEAVRLGAFINSASPTPRFTPATVVASDGSRSLYNPPATTA